MNATETSSSEWRLQAATNVPPAASGNDPNAVPVHRSAPTAPDYDGGTGMPGSVSDEDLLVKYRNGDQASFRTLVERYQRELFHFLIRFLGDRAMAEDTFQETFLQVHESAADFDVTRRLRPWLFTIAANKARDVIRSRSRRPVNALQAAINPNDEDTGRFVDLMNANVEMPGEALERAELAQRVHNTILEMPVSLREILLLAYFSQFPYKQIGDILAIPLGTVKSRLHTAVGDFASRWKKSNKDPEAT